MTLPHSGMQSALALTSEAVPLDAEALSESAVLEPAGSESADTVEREGAPESPSLAASRPPSSRLCLPRASAGVARQRIQDTLDWENCDEDSGRFRAVAQQFDDEFDKEQLEEIEMDQMSGSSSALSESASDDDDESYESSFVTDGSGSEEEEDSEDEWMPVKKTCIRDATNVQEPELSELTDGAAASAAASAASPCACISVSGDEASVVDVMTHAMPECDAESCPEALDDAPEAAPEVACLQLSAEELDTMKSPCPHAEELDSPVGFYNLWVL